MDEVEAGTDAHVLLERKDTGQFPKLRCVGLGLRLVFAGAAAAIEIPM